MTPQANVGAIFALDELRSAWVRFGTEALDSLHAIMQDIRRTQDWLADRHAYWQREVRTHQETLRQAQAALNYCQSQIYYDPQTGRSIRPDCSAFESRVIRARTTLAAAEAELENVRRWLQRVQQVVTDYERQAQHLASRLTNDVPQAAALLSRSTTILQSYAMMGLSDAGAELPLSPVPQVHQTVTGGQTVDSHVQDVPLDLIDLDDSYVQSSADFHKVPYEEMRAGVQKLVEVVRPAMQAGADGDYFSQLDAQHDLDYTRGYRIIYDAFYGTTDPIRLEKTHDRYQVIGGYHRLLVAKELGLHSIPAHVITVTSSDEIRGE